MMRTRIQKWGNSLAVRIPKAFAQEVGVNEDAEVELTVVNRELVVTPLIERVYYLEDLLAGIRKNQLHKEIERGPAVGREAW